jgi:hypothetical protein
MGFCHYGHVRGASKGASHMLQDPWHILELFVKSSCFLHPVFGPPFTPYSLFQWYLQSKEIFINVSMKC